MLVPWYLKQLVVGKRFPSLRKKWLRGWRDLRSNCSYSTLIENKLRYVNTELVLSKLMKFTGDPKQSDAYSH